MSAGECMSADYDDGWGATVFYREMETVVPDDHKDVLLFLYILLPGSNSINVSDFCSHSRQIRIDRTRAQLRTY